MRKVEVEQGTENWLNWRKGLITATDAPILLGVSPYATPYKGWQRKLGLIEEQQRNPGMDLGIKNEPIAREAFIKRTNIKMMPCVIESEKYNFIGASLDGLSECGRYILELKYNNAELHEEICKRSTIPDYHQYQMQHQMLSSDGQVEKCLYGSFNNGELSIVEVFPNHTWLSIYLEKAREFWRRVVLFDPPPLSNKDCRDRSSNSEWNRLSSRYSDIDEHIKKLQKEKESCKEALIDLCENQTSCGNGIKVITKTTKGRIDYEAILSLDEIQNVLKEKKVDTEKFRKPSSSSWTILIDTK